MTKVIKEVNLFSRKLKIQIYLVKKTLRLIDYLYIRQNYKNLRMSSVYSFYHVTVQGVHINASK